MYGCKFCYQLETMSYNLKVEATNDRIVVSTIQKLPKFCPECGINFTQDRRYSMGVKV